MENRLYKESYGAWGGNPHGTAPDFSRCCEEVYDSGRGGLFHQCGRKRGYGPDEAYCKQHDPEAVKARREEQDRRGREKWNKRRYEFYGRQFYNALKLIADGHNDPRTLARETIAHFHKGDL